jgi:hypothetical protein
MGFNTGVKMAKRKRALSEKKSPAEQSAQRKKVFKFLERLVHGAVKLWFIHKGVQTPFIVAVDQASELTQDVIDSLE